MVKTSIALKALIGIEIDRIVFKKLDLHNNVP